MMSITQAIRTAARLLGSTVEEMAAEADVRPEQLSAAFAAVEAIDRVLTVRGLRLAVRWMDRPPLDIPDTRVLAAAEREYLARGETGVRHRLARLLRIEFVTLCRVLDNGRQLGGVDCGAAARKRLWDHRLDPARHPLPPHIRRGSEQLEPVPVDGARRTNVGRS